MNALAQRPGPTVVSGAVLVALVAIVASLGVLAGPMYGLGAAALACLVTMPRAVGLASVFGIAVLGSLFNPVVAGSNDEGRIYLTTVLSIAVFACGGLVVHRAPALRARFLWIAALVVVFTIVLTRLGTRPDLAWVYRPVQLALVAAGVMVLVTPKDAGRIYRLAVIAGVVSCALGVVNFLVPAIDPFQFARPDDLAWESMAAGIRRGIGGFVYPNVFAMFGAYIAISGYAALVSGRLSPRLALAATVAGSLACLVSLSRAGLAGLFAALAIVTVVHSKRLGAVVPWVTLGTLAAGLIASYNAELVRVVVDRAESAVGSSLQLRQENTAEGVEMFSSNPLIGVGIQLSRLDNGYLLYLGMGGLVGGALLIAMYALASGVGRRRDGNFVTRSPELLGLWTAIAVSSVVQDVVGQTLSTWYVGLVLGLGYLMTQASDSDLAPQHDPPSRRHPVSTLRRGSHNAQ